MTKMRGREGATVVNRKPSAIMFFRNCIQGGACLACAGLRIDCLSLFDDVGVAGDHEMSPPGGDGNGPEMGFAKIEMNNRN